MRSRSGRRLEKRDDGGETSCAKTDSADAGKRPYNRKSLLCRLCLRTLAKEELPEIFALGSDIQRAIRMAVGVKVSRKDRSIRICRCCLDLVHLINDFRAICDQTDLLLSQNVDISEDLFWKHEPDQKAFGKSRILVEECKREVERLIQEQDEVYCPGQSNDLIDESRGDDGPASDREEAASKFEPVVSIKDEIVKEEVESDPGFSGADTDDDDPDYDEEERKEPKKDSGDDSSEGQPEIVKKRRGRPPLPKHMLKRQRREPGEPRKKAVGRPRNGPKLPAKSVCEICGILVNRENHERHQNEHQGLRPYVCTQEGCTHAFSSKAGLNGHLARHTDQNIVYDCDICGAKIKSKSSLHRHRKMHTMTEKPHACQICGKRFWRKAYLNHHSTVHTGIAKFPCEYCGFVFKNKYWRAFHVKQKHVAKGEVPKFEAQQELDENGEMPEGPPELGEEYVENA